MVWRQRKHPHGRGEDSHTLRPASTSLETPPRAWGRQYGADRIITATETPPRAWGRPLLNQKPEKLDGNTPTGVGKTSLTSCCQMKRPKHPHGRGEDNSDDSLRRSSEETPPRAWGRRCEFDIGRPCNRNTPTGVGKTPAMLIGLLATPKHPHGRGEDWRFSARLPNNQETPPRAWGRPKVDELDYPYVRNTPTGVGKT